MSRVVKRPASQAVKSSPSCQHDARGDSTIIAGQARISSDASPQPATHLTHAVAEAFVAGLVASKEENRVLDLWRRKGDRSGILFAARQHRTRRN